MRFIKTTFITLLVVFLGVQYSFSQIIAPTGTSTRASSQLVYYYDQADEDTTIQIVNTHPTTGVWIHVQIFRSFNAGDSTTPNIVLCDERDFIDFLTPTDTHVYDLSSSLFPKNTGETEADAGESTSINVTGTKGFIVITPVVSESDLSAISFQFLTGSSKDDSVGFTINAMGRDAVSFSTGEIEPIGTVLDGTTNGYVVLQPEELLFDFTTDENPVDIVGVAFNDVYGPSGLLGYQVTPADLTWTSFIFDFKEDPTSCGVRPVNCFTTAGLNDNLEQNNTELSPISDDLLCAGAETPESPFDPSPAPYYGWTRIFVSGMGDFENHIGYFVNTYPAGADFMYVRGQRTEINPPPTNEICDDEAMADEDGNGFANCLDPACATAANCETGAEECADTVDNDSDGKIDCLDEGCDGFVGCEFGTEVSCDDGIDNDADGQTDCNDTDCAAAEACGGGTTGGGGGGGCVVAGSVSAATAAANMLLPLLPLFGAYGIRRRFRK